MQRLLRISKKTLVHGVLFLLLSCCSEKRDPTLHEAARIHNDVFKLMERLGTQLDKMGSQSHPSPDSVRSWRIHLDAYSKQLIEVPGSETHQHSDHHHHGESAELTSQQILLIQQEVQNSVETLKRRMDEKVKH